MSAKKHTSYSSGPPSNSTSPHPASRGMRIEDLVNTDSGSSSGNSDNNDEVTLVPAQPTFTPLEPSLPMSMPFIHHNRESHILHGNVEHRSHVAVEQPPLKCPFSECNKKTWFPGFPNRQDLDEHLLFHRCQWCLRKPDGFYKPCMYVPKSEQDGLDHIQSHIDERDSIPSIRSDDQRLLFFCPWSLCSSNAYCVKGTSNKGHIVLHLKKHMGQQ